MRQNSTRDNYPIALELRIANASLFQVPHVIIFVRTDSFVSTLHARRETLVLSSWAHVANRPFRFRGVLLLAVPAVVVYIAVKATVGLRLGSGGG